MNTANYRATSLTDGKRNSFIKGRVGIVGLGLMGGSFAKALSSANVEVYAWNRTHSTLELAMIETVAGELDDDVIPSCELIILSGYPASSIAWLSDKATLVAPEAIVIDVAGVKRSICEACAAIANTHSWTFVGCHPMAGTQYSGYAHARATMFRGAPMVVVPPSEMDDLERADLLARLKKLLEPCGFGSYTLASASEHDEMIAYTSQLAHVVSNAYVKSPAAQRHKGFSAGSYRDLTRVARLNATMWSELFLDNADYLSNEIACLIENLAAYKKAIDEHDAKTLHDLLAEGDRLKREAERS